MYFIIDEKRKIVFGWSAKCGCCSIKKIFYYFQGIKKDYIHEGTYNAYPNGNYTTILFIRNPYKRLVSGFIQKYVENNHLKQYQLGKKYLNITFEKFVNELDKNGLKRIEKHHFTPQLSEKYKKNIKFDMIMDIEKIDYKYLEDLFKMELPIKMKNAKNKTFYEENNEKCFDWSISKLMKLEKKPYYKDFYNKDIELKVLKFYSNDFNFFTKNGFNYYIENI